MVHMSLYHS